MAGVKHDQSKPDWSLMPFHALEEVVRVLDHGAAKYGRDNWKELEHAEQRYFAAALRHLTAWHTGERYDQDSELPHLAHAACSILFLLHKEIGDDELLQRHYELTDLGLPAGV
jgi:hypothetical protein